jgi:hypothetical protein
MVNHIRYITNWMYPLKFSLYIYIERYYHLIEGLPTPLDTLPFRFERVLSLFEMLSYCFEGLSKPCDRLYFRFHKIFIYIVKTHHFISTLQ